MKSKFFRTYFVVILITVLVMVFDLLTKYILIPKLIPNVGDSVDFIKGFINFVHVQNQGASWGIFSGQTYFLIVISILILLGILFFYMKKIKDNSNQNCLLLSFAVGFIAGGCLGNMYDRIVLGYVRDFINFQFMDFPVFNIADCSLTIGVLLFILYVIIDYAITIKNEKSKKQIDEEVHDKELFKEALTETLNKEDSTHANSEDKREKKIGRKISNKRKKE